MKFLAILSIVGGIAALVLAIIAILANHPFGGITGAGFLRGSSSLFLLALALMLYKKVYQSK